MKSRKSRRAAAPAPPVPPPVAKAPFHRWVEIAIGMALLGSAWLLDPWAEAAFDAPKRFIVLLAAVLGVAALVVQPATRSWRTWTRSGVVILVCMAVACLGLLLATLFSPHPVLARSGFRTLFLFALFLPLGASAAFGVVRERLLQVGLLAVAVNVVISLLQSVGAELPLPTAHNAGRFPTGALLGNEGYVALAAALAAAACAAVWLRGPRGGVRHLALLIGLLCVATIAVNRQLTSALALFAALLTVVAVRWRAPWLVWSGAAVLVLAVLAALVPPLRAVSYAHWPARDVESYQKLTTYRLSAWAAAQDMIATRPWLGYGPGSFGAEAQTHRLAAEIALHERLVPPPTASAFVYAHQDYLQLAAEAGVPTLLALLAAFVTLCTGLLRRAVTSAGAEEPLLLALLVVGAVAALAWFPLQIPFTAVVLLLACGRAFRLVGMPGEVA